MTDSKILGLEPHYESGSQITFNVQLPNPKETSVFGVNVRLDGSKGQELFDLVSTVGAAALQADGRWQAVWCTSPWATWSINDNNQLVISLAPLPDLGTQGSTHQIAAYEYRLDPLGFTLADKKPFQIGAASPPAEAETTSDLEEVIADLGSVPVSLRARAAQRVPLEEVHWIRILAANKALSYDAYVDYVKANFCATESVETGTRARPAWNGVRAYERLRDVTEQFVQETCEAIPTQFVRAAVDEALARLDRKPDFDERRLNDTVPQNLLVVSARLPRVAEAYELACLEPLDWCPVELIWSHWLEAGMLVQTMNAIARRFQNVRVGNGDRDPLANFEIAPLRALNHLLFGYVQDDRRLTVLRRAHEYEHEYGMRLEGRAVRGLRPADRRSKFVESFHNLLLRCSQFYKQLDDLTVRADAFPVLNAIKETHYLIAQGAHNQVGDLPKVARQEMLLEMWLLGTSEMRDFLHARDMVPYPEAWMDRVDAMKNIQGWTDTSVVHFRDLANAAEILVQSFRYGGWANQNDAEVARTWAMLFRAYVQVYTHAYRAVTGVDLTSDSTHPRQLQLRSASPSEHLQRRLAEQTARTAR